MRDRDVAPGTRELFVAPRAVEHRPRTGAETAILRSEPGGVASTGDLGRPLIAEVEERGLTAFPLGLSPVFSLGSEGRAVCLT